MNKNAFMLGAMIGIMILLAISFFIIAFATFLVCGILGMEWSWLFAFIVWGSYMIMREGALYWKEVKANGQRV